MRLFCPRWWRICPLTLRGSESCSMEAQFSSGRVKGWRTTGALYTGWCVPCIAERWIQRDRERRRKSSVGAIMWIILAGGREPACGCIKLNWHLLLLFNQATMLISVVWLFVFSLDKQLIVIWKRKYSGNAKIGFWNYFDQEIKEGKTNQGLIW